VPKEDEVMNIFEALTNHHDTLRDLFGQAASDCSKFPELKKHLQVHHKNEEKILYEVMKNKEPTRKDALEAIEEHHVIELLLVDLENFPTADERWVIKLEVLEEYTKHHLKEEEDETFPEGQKVIEAAASEEMGKRFEEIKAQQLAVL
jgi:hemerythrin-like domain-containing protein